MSPPRTRAGNRGDARQRLGIARKYLEVAELADSEAGMATNTVVAGICVLAGIAASDALCLSATRQRYTGTDHAEAVSLLATVDSGLASDLATLVRLKPLAHYGQSFVSDDDRRRALRAAQRLVDSAAQRA